MKKLLFTGVLISLSWFTMSCSTTAKRSESAQESSTPKENVASVNSNLKDSIKSIIIDVRTQGEWDNDGHATCTTLIPLDQLEQRIEELRPYQKITIVCRSGARAGKAEQMLRSKGFTEVYNAGPWQNAACN